VTDCNPDDRTVEKRRRVVEAAWRVARLHGLRGMTMEALAREAGVAKGTLYAHFADKDAVIGAVIDDMLVELRRQMDGQPDFTVLLKTLRCFKRAEILRIASRDLNG